MDEKYIEAFQTMITQLQQVIDLQMLMLQESNPRMAEVVDVVHNKLNMFMSDHWEESFMAYEQAKSELEHSE